MGGLATVVVIDQPGACRTAVCAAIGSHRHTVIAISPEPAAVAAVAAADPDVVVARGDDDAAGFLTLVRTELAAPMLIVVDAGRRGAWRSANRQVAAEGVFAIPDEMDELVRAVDRFASPAAPPRATGDQSEIVQVEDLTIDQAGHIVRRGGAVLDLTATEYRLLLDLCFNAGRVRSKRQLLERVWGFEAYDPNVVEVHISALRRKIEAHGPRLIQTVRGFGYVLRPHDDQHVCKAS